MPTNSINPVATAPPRSPEPPAPRRAPERVGEAAEARRGDGKDLPSAGEPRDASPGADLADAVSALNDYVQNIQRDLEFSVDRSSGRTVIKVIDSQSEEIIRQIPPEEVLNLVRKLEQARDGAILEVEV